MEKKQELLNFIAQKGQKITREIKELIDKLEELQNFLNSDKEILGMNARDYLTRIINGLNTFDLIEEKLKKLNI